MNQTISPSLAGRQSGGGFALALALTAFLSFGPGLPNAPAQVRVAGNLLVDLSYTRGVQTGTGLVGSETSVTNWVNYGALGGSFQQVANSPYAGTMGAAYLNPPFLGTNASVATPSAPGARMLIASFTTPPQLQGSAPHTIETWLWKNNTATDQRGVLAWTENTPVNGDAGKFSAGDPASLHNNGKDLTWNGNYPSSGAWHHTALTYDGTTETLYLDGVAVNSTNLSLNISSNSYYPMLFSGIITAAPYQTSFSFNGAIAVVRVHSGALAAPDVAANFAAGISAVPVEVAGQLLVDLSYTRGVQTATGLVGTDTSVTNWLNYGAAGGGFVKVVSSPYAGTMGAGYTNPPFLATNASVATPASGGSRMLVASFATPANLQGAGPYTLETWLWKNNTATDQRGVLAWTENTPGNGDAGKFSAGDPASLHNNGKDLTWNGNYPSSGAWHHTALTYDGTTETLYLDGVVVNSANTILSISANTYYPMLFSGIISAAPYQTSFSFNGAIAAVRVHSGVLSAGQVANNFLAGIAAVPGTSVAISLQTLPVTGLGSTSATLNGTLAVTADPASTAVEFFYGTTDKGDTVAGWDHTVVLPTPNNPGAVSTSLAGLTPNTTYYARIFGQNARGNGWSALMTFHTYGPPLIANTSAAPAGSGAESLNGTINPNGSATDVKVYWGPADGGTVAANWANVIDLGTQPLGTLSQTVSGLTPLGRYYYTFFASNASGSSWATPSVAFNAPILVPQPASLLFSLDASSLPTSGAAGNWKTTLPGLAPAGTPFVPLGNTTLNVQQFGGVTYANIVDVNNSGGTWNKFRLEDPAIPSSQYTMPIQLGSGATIVTVVKPALTGASDDNWQSYVDVLFNELSLGVLNHSGRICVGINDTGNTVTALAATIPTGQTTVISLVVQNSGAFVVYTNGVACFSGTAAGHLTSGSFTQLTPARYGTYSSYVDIGGEDPDSWSTENGFIGDVYAYTNALADVDRQSLEASLMTKFITNATLSYQITSSAGPNGALSPLGTTTVLQGNNQAYTITANAGYVINSVLVDSVSAGLAGASATYTFTNVNAAHTISVTFLALPPQNITASVTGTGGAINPSGTTSTAAGTTPTYSMLPNSGYAVNAVLVDGVSQGEIYGYTFPPVLASHTISVSFRPLDMNVPHTDQLLFAAVANALPGDGNTLTSWPTYVPAGQALAVAGGAPTSVIGVGGVGTNIWESNARATSDALRYTGLGGTNATYKSPIPCSGATIIAVVAPATGLGSDAWDALVSVFYNQLALDVRNDNGAVQVQLNGTMSAQGGTLSYEQPTVLSLVVQPGGSYSVYGNGLPILTGTGSPLTSLTPGLAGTYADYIEIGRNGVDGWSSFNGNIGDVFLYKTALTNSDRVTLEAAVGAKYGIPIPNLLFSGKVTLQDGVTPVAGALVTGAGFLGTYTATSGGDGTYSFYVISGDTCDVYVSSPAYSQVNASFSGVVSAATVYNFQMVPINTIQGTVRNASGAPIYNAVVQVGDGGPAGVTGTDGKYSIVISPGPGVSFYADALGYTNDTETIDTSAAATGLLIKNVVLAAQSETDYSYVQNGGFESGVLAPWYNNGTGPLVGVTNAVKLSGGYAGFWESTDANWYEGYIEQDIPVLPDSTYNIYYKVKGGGPGLTGQTGFNFADATGNALAWWGFDDGIWTSGVSGPGWMCYLDGAWDQVLKYRSWDYSQQTMGVRLTPPPGTTFIQILVGLGPNAAGQFIYLDDVVVDRVGPVAPALSPVITMQAGVPTFTFPTLANHSYVLVYKNALTDRAWTPIGTPTPGTGSPLTLTDTSTPPLPADRFYRLQLQ